MVSMGQLLSNCSVDSLILAARALKDGSLVAFPTETVYGLGADAANELAVARIYEVKGRPADHPLIVHIANIKYLEQWISDIPEYAITLAREFWPGPMTLILKRSELVRKILNDLNKKSKLVIVYSNPRTVSALLTRLSVFMLHFVKKIILGRRKVELDNPIYFYRHPNTFWTQFTDVAIVEQKAWRTFSPSLEKIFFKRFLGGKMLLKILFRLEQSTACDLCSGLRIYLFLQPHLQQELSLTLER